MTGPRLSDEERARLDVERVIFFSDAVFAIAITLLAIDLRLPPGIYTDATLADTLRAMGPEVFAFALTFGVIAMFWLGHHRTFRRLHRIDGRLTQVNLLFLAFVALLPFPTSVLAHVGDLPTAAAFYAAFVCLTSLLSSSLWVVADRRHLLSGEVTPAVSRHVMIRALSVSAVFALSIPVALAWGSTVAEVLWIASIVLQGLISRQFHLGG
jgi:uncharacterized membrane protein